MTQGPTLRAAHLSTLATVGFWLALLAPLAAGRTLWFRDQHLYLYPQKLYALDRLRHGELPLWGDVWGTGRPFFGLVQPGVLDPFNVLLLLPGTLGPDVYNLFHILVAMLGLRAWLRRLDLDPWDATVGALLFGLSGHMVSMVTTNGTYAWGVSFVPWALCVLASVRAEDPPSVFARDVVALAVALSLTVLSGDPMAGMFVGVLSVLQCLARADAAARRRAFGLLVAGGALAAMLCAVQLAPAAEVARTYRGSGVPLRNAENFSLHPLRLLELWFPFALGQPYSPAWGAPQLYTRTARQVLSPLVIGIHQGLPLLPLSLAALARRERIDRALWALVGVSLILALGRFTPVWPWCFLHVPGLNVFRHPEKYWLLATVALSALAARGLPLTRAWPRLSAAIALGHAALFAALAFTLAPPAGSALAALPAGLARAAVFAGLYALAFALPIVRRAPAWLQRAAPIALLAAELLAFYSVPFAWGRAADVRESAFARAIAIDRGGSARGARVYRNILLRLPVRSISLADEVESLAPDEGIAQGIGHLDVLDPIPWSRSPRIRTQLEAAPTGLLRWWGIEYAVVGRSFSDTAGTRLVAANPALGLRLLAVTGAAPRVYLAARTVTVRGPLEALAAARAPGFEPGVSATVEGPARAASGRCGVGLHRPERRVLVCESDAPAWVIVGESFDPVWKVFVNGAAVPTVRGNELYMAVPVPAGRAVVQMEVRPRGLRAGAAVSVAALALCAALLAASRRRARRAA